MCISVLSPYNRILHIAMGSTKQFRIKQKNSHQTRPNVSSSGESASCFLLLSHTVQRIDRISGKSGNGFRDDVVDFSIQRIPHHLVEFGAVIAVGAGGRFICIHTGKCPALFFIDQLRVIAFLSFISNASTKRLLNETSIAESIANSR